MSNKTLVKEYIFRCDIKSIGCMTSESFTPIRKEASWETATKDAESKGWKVCEKQNVCPRCQNVLKNDNI